MADFSSSTTHSIEQFPREIQDLIFDCLGDELIPFLRSRSTFPSALPALFKHACRALPRTDYLSMMENDRQLLCLKRITKSGNIHKALNSRPTWVYLVNELSLAVPNERVFVDEEHNITERLPSDWNDNAVSTLLRRCPKLRKLSLRAIWVKRCVTAASSSIVPYVMLPAARVPISIPSMIHELSIEDTTIEDAPSPAGVDLGDDFALWPYEHSNLLLKVTGLQHITKLTVHTPLFIDLSGKMLDVLPKLKNMSELILHHGRSCGGLDRFIMSEIFDALGHCAQLRVFEFLYPRTYEMDPFPEDWPQLVPQLRLFRTSLRRFADAFGNTGPSHDIRFEVLYDPRELINTEADEAFGGCGNPRQARKFIQVLTTIKVSLSNARQMYAERQQEMQNGGTSAKNSGRRIFEEEKRTLELLNFHVDETMDWYWFAHEDEEEWYLQSVNKGIYQL